MELQFVVVFIFFFQACTKVGETAKIRNLSGIGSFHSIRLGWERSSRKLQAFDTNRNSSHRFAIRFCENQSWGPHHCKVVLSDLEKLIKTADDGVGGFEAFTYNLEGLRMATSYSISVQEVTDPKHDSKTNSRSLRKFHPNALIVKTKGFSARATACNSTMTQILLETGPRFGGRISLEGGKPDLDGTHCHFEGNPDSESTNVLFSIDHNKCSGVEANSTMVRIFVVVQESRPILTHSTRRFLVVCHLKPNTFTVKAGLNMPPSELRRISDVLSFQFPKLDNQIVDSDPAKASPSRMGEGRSLVSIPASELVRKPRTKKIKYYYKIHSEEKEERRNTTTMGTTSTAASTSSSSTPPPPPPWVEESTTGKTSTTSKMTPAYTFSSALPTMETYVNNNPEKDGMPWIPSNPLKILSSKAERNPKSFNHLDNNNNDQVDVITFRSFFPHWGEDELETMTTEKNRVKNPSDQLDSNKTDNVTLPEPDYSFSARLSELFTVPDNYKQPTAHVVIMIILVVSATVGTAAILYWVVQNRHRSKITSNALASPPQSPKLKSVTKRSTISNFNSLLNRKQPPSPSDPDDVYEPVKPQDISNYNVRPQNVESFA